jgi:hypothetical protein
MRITALQPFNFRGAEVRRGEMVEVSDEYGVELTKKGLAKIDARDLTRILRGERQRTTPAAATTIEMSRR